MAFSFKGVWKIVQWTLGVLFIAQLLYVVMLRWVNPPVTFTQLNDRYQGYAVKQKQIGINSMSPTIKLAVLTSEDPQFPNHHGFNLTEIKKALHEDKLRGASTISQQVAKNVFLWQGGGWFRKGLEAYLPAPSNCYGRKNEFSKYTLT